MTQPQDAKLKELVDGTAYTNAKEWYRIMGQEFIPAVLSGDRRKAHEIRTTTMAKSFATEEAMVVEIVKITNDLVANDQVEAEAVPRSRTRMLSLVGLIRVTVVVGFAYTIAR